MHPDKLPFQVILHMGQFNKKPRPLLNFCQNAEEAVIDYTYLTEFIDVDLEFKANSDYQPPANARLYIDGLDGLANEQVQYDLEGSYLLCPCYISLYSNSDENTYPWIPGQYRVKVIWGDDVYFTVLDVRPKNITVDQLAIMRQELENCLRGLAIDFILRNQGIGSSQVIHSLPEKFYQYHLLERKFPRLYTVISDIVQRPYQQAIKEHLVVPFHKAKVWDNRTFFWLSSEPGRRKNHNADRRPQFVLAPFGKIHYDLPENQWIKKILIDLIKILSVIQRAIQNTLKYKRAELANRQKKQSEVEQLEKDLRRCMVMQGQFWQLLKHPFFAQVSHRSEYIQITPGLQKDVRYWLVYSFWQQLFQHARVQVQAAADYQWKRTDLLYEYWCFVKTIEALKEIGFEPQEGWIFSNSWRFFEPIFIPSIEPGTKVTFIKNNYRLDLVYDQPIPKDPTHAREIGIPVWSEGGKNNRPDMRLDIFRDGEYLYSTILEVKYRRKKYIWDTSQEGKLSSNTEQLKNYRLGLSLLNDSRRRAVNVAVALYPKDKEFGLFEKDPNHCVSFLQITPGEDNSHFIYHLENDILEMKL